MYEINSRLDTAEQKFRGLKDITMGAIKMKQWKKKRSQWDAGQLDVDECICNWSSKRRGSGAEKIFEDI